MASGEIENISSNQVEKNENDESVNVCFDDAREQPISIIPPSKFSNNILHTGFRPLVNSYHTHSFQVHEVERLPLGLLLLILSLAHLRIKWEHIHTSWG